MKHNSYPSNYENENNNQADDNYSQWQEAMQDVEFQGNLTSASTNQETIPISSTPEMQEAPANKAEKLLQKIQDTKEYVKTMLGISSEEKLTEMTDDALVYVAKETIATADEDGTRTEAESAIIKT